MFEDVPDGMIGVLTESRHANIVSVCDELEDVLPGTEPREVERYRALVLTADTLRESDEHILGYGNPIGVIQNVAMEARYEALDAIEERLALERPADEEDAEVIYIYDPVSKMRFTTALGGYKPEYDEARIDGQKREFAEQILYEPIPDTIPLV